MFRILINEIKHISKSRFAMYIFMPLITSIIVISTLSQSRIKNMPLGVLDLDNTALSRDILFNIDSTQAIKIINEYKSINEAKNDLNTGKIYALLVIPNNLQKDITKEITPVIALYYNAQYVLIGKNIYNAILQISSNINTKINIKKHMVNDKNTLLALGNSIDFLPKIMGLYNENSNYAQFLVTAILPCLWQLLAIFCMINLLANESKLNAKNIFAKVLINTFILFTWWIIMIITFRYFNYPMQGSIFVLALNAFITLIAYESVAIFIYSLSNSHIQAISMATIYSAPALAFIGITYPINNMNPFAVFWGEMMPLTKYMQVYIQQANYGVDSIVSLKLISKNLLFLLFGAMGFLIYKQKHINDIR